GVEPFVNSMQKLLSRIGETGSSNIRVYNDDSTQLLDWLPDGSLDIIDLLYPDPWSKVSPARGGSGARRRRNRFPAAIFRLEPGRGMSAARG
ncbi:hypothetical protein ACC738_37795, partial [Rhizobium ruizarguesonis]